MAATGNQVAAAGQIAMATDSRGHQHVVVKRRQLRHNTPINAPSIDTGALCLATVVLGVGNQTTGRDLGPT